MTLTPRFFVALLPMRLQQGRPDLIKQGFEPTPVFQSPAQRGHQLCGYIHTPAAAFLGKGQHEGWMFVALLAGRAVGPDAGLAHLGQGTFQSGPEAGQLVQESLLQHGVRSRWRSHVCMYIT